MYTDTIEVLASRNPLAQKEDSALCLEVQHGKARGTSMSYPEVPRQEYRVSVTVSHQSAVTSSSR